MEAKLLIAVPRPLRTLLTYTYSTDTPKAVVGCRVPVSLGHSSSIGVVLALDDEQAASPYKLKALRNLIDREPRARCTGSRTHPMGSTLLSARDS